MSFDLKEIIESKRLLRCSLIQQPIAEKLRLLDALHERELVIKNRRFREGKAPCANAVAARLLE